MNNDESKLIEKTSCPNCPSSDAYAIYDDGDGKSHGYCFSCNTYVHNLGDKQTTPPKDVSVSKNKTVSEFRVGSFVDLPKRKLKAETLKFFNYHIGEAEHYESFYDSHGRLVAQKVRTKDKDFRVIGDMKKAVLSGSQKYSTDKNGRVVVFEGKLDCMSYAQCTNLTWQCCSINSGAAGAARDVRRNIEWLEGFGEVVFCFDSDEAGRKAAIECAALLTPSKAKIATLPLKDASDMLVAGRVQELKAAIYQAKTYRPDGIIQGDEIDFTEIIKATPKGLDIPYLGLNYAIRGLRKRELVMLCAGSGIGKSTFAKELGVHLVREHKQKVGWIMLEESLQKTVQSIVAIDNNVPVGDLMENPMCLEQQDWDKSMHELVSNCSFYDAWGSSEVDNLITRMRYLAVGCECDFIILDHVAMVVSGLDVEERKTLDVLLTKLRQFCEQTGVGVIAVAHLRRNNTKVSFNNAGEVSLTDLRGSASLEQLSDVVVAIERNQMADTEEESETSLVRLLKNRPFGVTGKVGFAKYDKYTGRLKHHDFDNNNNKDDVVPF